MKSKIVFSMVLFYILKFNSSCYSKTQADNNRLPFLKNSFVFSQDEIKIIDGIGIDNSLKLGMTKKEIKNRK